MKKTILLFALIFCMTIGGILLLMISNSVIKNPVAKKCYVQTERIIKIAEVTSSDIVFSDTHGDHYYINRGLERGLNLDSLNAKVLNKTVTLHLPKLWFGTSEHIAQLTVDNEVIFSEFPSFAKASED